jgi:hypothetical protein
MLTLVLVVLTITVAFTGCASITQTNGIHGGARIARPAIVTPERNLQLYASLPDDDFFLYGSEGSAGYVLRHAGAETHFDWPEVTRSGIMPQMSFHDYDQDGEKELAVCLLRTSGTGLTLMDLHILTLEPTDPVSYRDFSLLSSPRDSLLTGECPFEIDGSDIIFAIDGREYVAQVDTVASLKEIIYSDMIRFNIDDKDKITVELGLAFLYDFGMPVYFANITADVCFDGESLALAHKKVIVREKHQPQSPIYVHPPLYYEADSQQMMKGENQMDATQVSVNITANSNLTLAEAAQSIDRIAAALPEDADISYGIDFDEDMKDDIKVTIIATDQKKGGGGSAQAPKGLRGLGDGLFDGETKKVGKIVGCM